MKGLRIIPDPHNRLDIGMIIETSKITTLKLKEKIFQAEIYPMFNLEFGSLKYADLNRQTVKVYPTFVHTLKYGVFFNKNARVKRRALQQSIQRLEKFIESPFDRIKCGLRF